MQRNLRSVRYQLLRWAKVIVSAGIIVITLTQAQALAVRAASQPRTNSPPAPIAFNPRTLTQVYFPLITSSGPQITHQPMLVGTYPVDQYLGTQSVIDTYLIGLDTWAGLSHSNNQGHSLAGTFMALEDASASYNIPQNLNTIWNNNFTPFINLNPDGRTAANVASGCCDAAIQTWADYYLAWTNLGGNRRAFIAPMPEMNWNASSWSYHPADFIAAYLHIKGIFEQRGVSRGKIWWVFAPNGYSSTPYHIIDYYPGDADVDLIGFSSYNQSCLVPWMSPAAVFDPYITEIRTTVSANKPVFVAQAASASTGGDKDQWLRDAYADLYQQGVRGVLYFNGNKECDWAVYRPDQSAAVTGYKDAVSTAFVHYVPPATLATTTLPP